MLLTLLVLSFGAVQAADLVTIGVYDVTNDVLLNPATDTIVTQDAAGIDLPYQLWFSLENDDPLGGMSLGFRIFSVDGVTWQYQAQTGGWGEGGQDAGFAAVTIVTGSRMDPVGDVFDMTDLLVTEKDVDGMLDDTVLFGGVSLFGSLPAGTSEPMMALHFIAGGVAFGEVKNLCFDSSFVPPAGTWAYSSTGGTTYPPDFSGQLCFPVITLNPNDVGDNGDAIPATFGISQNYPNPFNPDTKIEYSVARKTHVNISVFNILGQQVSNLVNEEVDAGVYEVIWDGRNDNGSQVASGIYFYKMDTDEYVETRKMVLMR
jgi:hypothetical protein